jgi:hypothetical protein
MASIITATTTSGLTQSADNSGVLQLASGTGNLVTVPSVTGTAMVSGNMPAFSAYQSSAQTLLINTNTKITFTTEEFDTANCFTSSRFTPNVAGYYQVSGGFAIGATACGHRLQIFKNGAVYKTIFNALSTTVNAAYGSALVSLNGSTDYVELFGYVGVAQILTASIEDTYFQASMVRAA